MHQCLAILARRRPLADRNQANVEWTGLRGGQVTSNRAIRVDHRDDPGCVVRPTFCGKSSTLIHHQGQGQARAWIGPWYTAYQAVDGTIITFPTQGQATVRISCRAPWAARRTLRSPAGAVASSTAPRRSSSWRLTTGARFALPAEVLATNVLQLTTAWRRWKPHRTQ